MRSKQERVSQGSSTTKTSAPAVGKTTLTGALPTPPQSPSYGVQMQTLFGAPPPAPTPIGTRRQTDFGYYWVVPDGTKPAAARIGQRGELIEQSVFNALETAWNQIKDYHGGLRIEEVDKYGEIHSGFKTAMLPRVGMLMSKPKGRELVLGLVNGSNKCIVRPSAGKLRGGGFTIPFNGLAPGAPGIITNGKRGAGDYSFVEIDPDVNDNDVKVHDPAGNEIASPVYIFLGHELIHARHVAAGEAMLGPATDPSYDIREEEVTIETGGITENALRKEHGLKPRHDNRAVDKRP